MKPLLPALNDRAAEDTPVDLLGKNAVWRLPELHSLVSGESAFDRIFSIYDIFIHSTGDETVGER
jgi:hypothetical protein